VNCYLLAEYWWRPAAFRGARYSGIPWLNNCLHRFLFHGLKPMAIVIKPAVIRYSLLIIHSSLPIVH
jgi:hypothetical protein